MSELPIVSSFNDGYIAEQYEAFRRDPNSVDASWRQYFQVAESISALPAAAAPAADVAYLRKVAGAAALVQAIRQYGHLDVQLDPLGSPPLGAPELKPEFHGISAEDLPSIPGAALGFQDGTTAADIVKRLRALYSSTIGFEFEHIQDENQREWFRKVIEGEEMRRHFTPNLKKQMLRRLSEVEGLERFIGRAYQGYKRFSIEGTDALVPMLDAAIDRAAHAGARQVVIAMAHRGRINVLAHILDKPIATIFAEFEGKHAAANAASDTGDVKYHLGASTERTMTSGEAVRVWLVPNPSHLEFVNPVLEGVARALQRVPGAPADGPPRRDESSVLPVLVHGDAAFVGEGVVAETFNLSALVGYQVGGTLHIIVNNQVGFTTDPRDGRSTHYASDLAKGFEVPIVHVNADDPESCVSAVWLSLAYRERFGKDFLIDLVGYRRQGHNETDEPSYTQPAMYGVVRNHPTAREVWGKRLVREGIVTPDEVLRLDAEVQQGFERIHATVKAPSSEHSLSEQRDVPPSPATDTSVSTESLTAINERLLSWPAGFTPVPKLARQLERRRNALGDLGGIDWGHAEALAWGSLLVEGISVRVSGQDTERGTFSHRQAVLHDVETGATYTPLQHLPNARGTFEIYNSPLSEVAVLGFEYGYSVAADDTLVCWEAQFGDFGNVAQPIIDQFVAADRAKWGQNSGVVLLLPHGYEGQGPEHSSARLERFLQLCADGNLRAAYPTSPAQYFHILRRQAKLSERRPLVLMQPKSLLRLPEAASRLAELAHGSFRPVIDDPEVHSPEDVRRLVLCTGKVYYDLAAKREGSPVAVARVEELNPWPHEQIARLLDRYSAIEEVVWAQEEPKNMGAWSFVAPRLRGAVGNALPLRYVGRPERASPAEGYQGSHTEQQAQIVASAVGGEAGVVGAGL